MGFELSFAAPGRLFRIGECYHPDQAPYPEGSRRILKALGGAPGGRFGTQIRVRDTVPVGASDDTLLRSGFDRIQDVSKYFPGFCCSCQALSLSITIMGAPQVGQVQAVPGAQDLPAPEGLAGVVRSLCSSC